MNANITEAEGIIAGLNDYFREAKIYFFKSLIPLAGGLLILQGFSECMRCILCIRDGKWLKRHEDVRETEEDLISRKKEEERQRKALGH